MADEIDRANDLAAAYASDGIAHSRRALQSRALEPCGACHWCGELLREVNQLFCDQHCADDLATQQKRETGRSA